MPRALKRVVVHKPLVKLPSVSDDRIDQPTSDNPKRNTVVCGAKPTISLARIFFIDCFAGADLGDMCFHPMGDPPFGDGC